VPVGEAVADPRLAGPRPELRLVLAVSLDGRLAPADGGAAQLGGAGDRQVLEEAIARNLRAHQLGISPYYHEAGTRGTWANDASPFLVYDRANEPCARCGSAIRRCEQAGRSTYWCPGCQR
jgi:formamidopyrimidine-DNA glycosylase